MAESVQGMSGTTSQIRAWPLGSTETVISAVSLYFTSYTFVFCLLTLLRLTGRWPMETGRIRENANQHFYIKSSH